MAAGACLRLVAAMRARCAGDCSLRMMLAVLLCLGSLFGAGVVQAAHVHDAPISLAADKHVLLAPAEDCPFCAATHVAMPTTVETTVQLLPRVERVAFGTARRVPPLRRWGYERFSRPPPETGFSRTQAAGLRA